MVYAEVTPGNWEAIGSATSHTLNITKTLADSTNKGSAGWRDNMYAQGGITIDMEGFTDPTDTLNEFDLFALITARTNIMLRWQGQSVPIFYEITGQISSYSKSIPNEDVVTYSLSFKATGKLEQYIIPISVEVPAAGTTVIVDCGVDMGTSAGSHASWTANDGGARTFSAAAAGATPNLIVLTLVGAAILGAATVTLSYSGATAINGVAYGTLAPFTALAVTNNSTQT